MDLHIDDKEFNFWEFPEKISQLKKKNKIDFNVSLYVYDNQVKSISMNINTGSYLSDLEFLKNLTELPDTIFVSKSKYYYWVFTGCKLLDVSVHQDKNFTDYRDRNIEKFDAIISISYDDVYGSNNKNLVDRDIKLKQLFG
jgi:hypothetical protein